MPQKADHSYSGFPANSKTSLVCILTSKWLLHKPFGGQNRLLGGFNIVFQLKPKKRKKIAEIHLNITNFLLLQGNSASFHIVGTPSKSLVGHCEPGLVFIAS